MAKRGFDLLLVKKSGPVRSLSLGGFWAYAFLAGLIAVLAMLGGGGYLLYRQSAVVAEMAEDTKLLMLRAERLESLVQEQETREILTQQSNEERPMLPPKSRGKQAQVAPAPASGEEAGEAGQGAEAPPGNEPQTSDRLSIANIDHKVEGGDLVVSFDLNNEREPRDPAVGFITVVARGQRQGRPWTEAWPPMRLTPQGRPQNYHAGTPFTVQRFRRVRAKVASLEDKRVDLLEFVVYSRQGTLIMVKPYPVALGKDTSRGR